MVGYLAKLAAGIPVEWVGKHTLFRVGVVVALVEAEVHRSARAARRARRRTGGWLLASPERGGEGECQYASCAPRYARRT